MQQFDAIILGAGQAGPPLAARLTASGQRVALVERHLFGGTCVNTGCTPTKAMVASAYAAHTARRGHDYGFTTGPVAVDLAAVNARRDAIVMKSRTGVEKSLCDNKLVTVFKGTASFTSPTTVRVGDHLLEAKQIFVNVGCRATIPDLPGIHDVPFLDNTSLLALNELPEHLIIVGGGYIGIEFAQIFRRFGSEVTIVEKSPRLAIKEDEDVSACIQSILEAEGITVRTSAECISLAPHKDGVRVGTNCTTDSKPVLGSHVLIAVGRTPNTQDLGLDKAGVATDKHGFIPVDDQCRTNVPGIYALGDCNGRGAFTHTAYNDYEIVAANLLDQDDRKISDRIPLLCHVPRPAARAHRHHRSRCPQIRQTGTHRHAPHVARQPRAGEGRVPWLYEGTRRRRHQTHPRSITPRHRLRRGHPLPARRDVRPRAVHHHLPRRTHPPHRLRTYPYATAVPQAAHLTTHTLRSV